MDDPGNRSRKDPLAAVLLAAAGLLGALGLYQLCTLARGTSAQVEIPKETQPADVQSRIAADKSVAGSLKKKNLFTPPAPPRHPVTEVAGILGSEALIDGKWYKAGAKVGEGPNAAVIVAVEPTRIRVKWNGRETEFLPIHASSGASGGGPNAPGEGRRGGPSVARPESAAVQPESAPARSGGARRGGLSQEEMAAYAERMKNASSDEERRQIMEERRQRRSGQ
jgi:hypothetical protein